MYLTGRITHAFTAHDVRARPALVVGTADQVYEQYRLYTPSQRRCIVCTRLLLPLLKSYANALMLRLPPPLHTFTIMQTFASPPWRSHRNLRALVLSARPRYLQDLAGPEFTQLLTWCQQNNWFYQTLRPVCSTEESRVGREQVSVTFEVNTPGNNPGRRSERNPPLQVFYSTQWQAPPRRETGVNRGARKHIVIEIILLTDSCFTFASLLHPFTCVQSLRFNLFTRHADEGAPRVIVLRGRPGEEASWQYLKKGHRFLYYALRYPLLFYDSTHFSSYLFLHTSVKYCKCYFMFTTPVRTAVVRLSHVQLTLV